MPVGHPLWGFWLARPHSRSAKPRSANWIASLRSLPCGADLFLAGPDLTAQTDDVAFLFAPPTHIIAFASRHHASRLLSCGAPHRGILVCCAPSFGIPAGSHRLRKECSRLVAKACSQVSQVRPE